MPEPDFSSEEFLERRKRVRSAMSKAGIDLLMVTSPVNINYLVGCRTKGYQQFQVLFFPLKDEPLTFLTRMSELPETLDTCSAEDIQGWGGPANEDPVNAAIRIIEQRGYSNLKIGLEVVKYYLGVGEYQRLIQHFKSSQIIDASGLVDELKLIKSPSEISYIRRASSIADRAMEVCINFVVEGVAESSVAAEVYRSMLLEGGELAASPMNLGSGPRSCYAHPAPSNKLLARGDFMHIEYGVAYRKYCALLGRQFCLGKPTQRMREIFDVVRLAGDEFMDKIGAGVAASEPYNAAWDVIRKAGMEKFCLHTMGYGIAPAFPPMWGERLDLSAESSYTLEAGMVVSVEPPVFSYVDRLGARLVDTVLVTDTGCELLSQIPRELIVL